MMSYNPVGKTLGEIFYIDNKGYAPFVSGYAAFIPQDESGKTKRMCLVDVLINFPQYAECKVKSTERYFGWTILNI